MKETDSDVLRESGCPINHINIEGSVLKKRSAVDGFQLFGFSFSWSLAQDLNLLHNLRPVDKQSSFLASLVSPKENKRRREKKGETSYEMHRGDDPSLRDVEIRFSIHHGPK